MRSTVLALLVARVASGLVSPTGRAGAAPTANLALAPRSLASSTVSNPLCSAVDPAANRCVVDLRSFTFSDDGMTSPFLGSVDVSIDGRLRLHMSAFFEPSIYFAYGMAPEGLAVDCGLPGEGGAGTTFGKVHTVVIEPVDQSGASMGSDYAVVPCPAAIPPTTTTTTTTLPPCAAVTGLDRARCELDTALGQPLCGATAIPPAVDRRIRAKLESASALLEKAAGAQGRRPTRFLARARRVLDKARAIATHAARAKRPARRLDAGCAVTIGDLVATVEELLPQP